MSSVLATWLLLPGQFNSFAKSLFATMLFASNVLFWRETGYFAAPASEQPLLHTWSLAVEEQFYVVFPLVLCVIHRWLKGRWVAWLAPLAILSFALSVWGVGHKPGAAFYLAPTRAWELLLGSLLALEAFPRLPSRLLMEVLAAAGLGLIAWGVVGLSATSPFPGLNALYPCLGAALVIYSGQATPTYTKDIARNGAVGLHRSHLLLALPVALAAARLRAVLEHLRADPGRRQRLSSGFRSSRHSVVEDLLRRRSAGAAVSLRDRGCSTRRVSSHLLGRIRLVRPFLAWMA